MGRLVDFDSVVMYVPRTTGSNDHTHMIYTYLPAQKTKRTPWPRPTAWLARSSRSSASCAPTAARSGSCTGALAGSQVLDTPCMVPYHSPRSACDAVCLWVGLVYVPPPAMNKSQQTYNARTRYGVELRNTVNMLETHDLGHSIYRSVVRLLQTFLQVSLGGLGWGGGVLIG